MSDHNNSQDTLTTELKECLKYIYASTRLTADLKAFEQKLDSLMGIRSTFNSDPQKSVTVDGLDSTIDGIKNDIETKRNELKSNEGEVQKRFQTMVETLTESCINKATGSRDQSNQILLKFSTDLKDNVGKEHARLNAEVEKLKEQVEAAKKKELALKNELAETKASLLKHQEDRFNEVNDNQIVQLKKLNDKVDNYVALVDKEKLAKYLVEKVQGYVSNYREEQKNQRQSSSSDNSNNAVPNHIKDYIRKQIDIKLEQLKPPANATIAQEQLESLEKTTNELSRIIKEQKSRAESTHKVLANFKPSSSSSNDQTEVLTKHMEEVERHITVMYHNIKMVENFINFKVSNIAGGLSNGSLNGPSRKRMRTENGEMEVDDEDEDISTRLAALEEKHQQMIDFIVQFRDNVLDPAFPGRMESALSKIEQVLLNHETFLSFFIDPFSTQQNLQKMLPSSSSSTDNNPLDPALIQAITDLVRKTNDEVAHPLEEKMKELEQKLNTRRPVNQ